MFFDDDVLNLFLHDLYQYHVLLYVNENYLKQIKYSNKPIEGLEVWDESLSNYAEKIYEYRKEYVNKIKEKINIIHSGITEEKENILLEYISDFDENKSFYEILKENRKKDIEKGRKKWYNRPNKEQER